MWDTNTIRLLNHSISLKVKSVKESLIVYCGILRISNYLQLGNQSDFSGDVIFELNVDVNNLNL